MTDGVGPRVLVVDDEIDLRSTIAEALALVGYEVNTAIHGQEALQKLRSGDGAALVLLDVKMPIMDGLEFLGQVRKDASRQWPPIIVISASCDYTADDLGVAAVVSKPFELETLVGAIETALHGAKLGGEE